MSLNVTVFILFVTEFRKLSIPLTTPNLTIPPHE